MGRSLRVAALFGLVLATPAAAGPISRSWDPTTGAAGYHVYYGTSSGQYSNSVTSTSTSTTLTGLQDCAAYFVAVKAFNAAGESPDFSAETSGWARPTV